MIDLWEDRNWGPMLLHEIKEPFDSDDYIFEIKYDGIRAIVFASPKKVFIQSRNKKDITNLFPELQEIKNLVKGKVIFDGEIICTENDMPSFRKLQDRSHLKNKQKIDWHSKNNPATFVVFDILYNNKNLINMPLIERKELLDTFLNNNVFIKTNYFDKYGKKLFQKIKKLKLEGIIAKKKDGIYYPSKRCDEFIKIKNIQRDEFYILGYIEKNESVVSLLLSEKRDDKYYFVGKVLMGKKKNLYKKLTQEKNSKNYFDDYKEDGAKYIKPSITCHVEYLERTNNNHLRHPVYKDFVGDNNE